MQSTDVYEDQKNKIIVEQNNPWFVKIKIVSKTRIKPIHLLFILQISFYFILKKYLLLGLFFLLPFAFKAKNKETVSIFKGVGVLIETTTIFKQQKTFIDEQNIQAVLIIEALQGIGVVFYSAIITKEGNVSPLFPKTQPTLRQTKKIISIFSKYF